MRLRETLPAAAVLAIAMSSSVLVWASHDLGRCLFDVLAFALGLVLALLAACGRSGLRVPKWALLALLPAAWGALQLAAGSSVHPFSTSTAALHWAALGVYVVVAAGVARTPRGCELLLAGFGCFVIAIAAVSLVQYCTSHGRVFWLFPSGYDRVLGPFPNRNTFATLCEIGLPVAIWLAIRWPPARPWAVTGAGLLLAVPMVTGSRAGALLLAAEAVAVAAVLGRRWRPAIALAAAAFVLFVVSAGWQPLFSRLQDRDPWAYRREAGQSSAAMIRDRPLTGFGLGTFVYAYPAYALVDYGAVLTHAHDDWAEFAAEGGLPFAATLLLAAGTASWFGARRIWGLGLPFVFLHACVDFPLQVDGVLVWILIAGAGAITQGNPRHKKARTVDTEFVPAPLSRWPATPSAETREP